MNKAKECEIDAISLPHFLHPRFLHLFFRLFLRKYRISYFAKNFAFFRETDYSEIWRKKRKFSHFSRANEMFFNWFYIFIRKSQQLQKS